MKKQKVHYWSYDVLKDAPAYVKKEYYDKGEDGAICGYVRKNTTMIVDEVTCFYCLKEMGRRGIK